MKVIFFYTHFQAIALSGTANLYISPLHTNYS